MNGNVSHTRSGGTYHEYCAVRNGLRVAMSGLLMMTPQQSLAKPSIKVLDGVLQFNEIKTRQ